VTAVAALVGWDPVVVTRTVLLSVHLIENVGPTSTVTVTFLVPVFGLLFGVWVLGEPFGPGRCWGSRSSCSASRSLRAC
jgi:drug/metabolite transporter (DMT)-like permease